jgi:hypothetical protein
MLTISVNQKRQERKRKKSERPGPPSARQCRRAKITVNCATFAAIGIENAPRMLSQNEICGHTRMSCATFDPILVARFNHG